MAYPIGLVALFVSFLATPFIVFSYVVAQQRRLGFTAAWYSTVTAMLALSMVVAVLAALQV